MFKRGTLILIMLLLTVGGAQAADQHFFYDDGSTETCIGGAAADFVWLQYFDTDGRVDTITHVSTAIGSVTYPGGDAPSHYGAYVYVWDDPNNDGDPSDAVLLGQGHGYVRNVNTDLFTHYPLDEPVTVSSRYFIGARVCSDNSCWPKPLDMSQASNGRSWSVTTGYMTFDPYDLTNNDNPLVEQDTTSYPGVWLLRAHCFNPEVDGQSFDWSIDPLDVPGWDERTGDWTVTGRQLVSEASASNQTITRQVKVLADGCVEVQGIYGDGVGLRYAGAVVRYISDTDRIMVKLQDNGDNGYFDTCYVYEDTSIIFSEYGQNYGSEPTLQVAFTGTSLQVRIDTDNDGTWEHEYPVTVTTTQNGYVGLAAYNQCRFDDWYCGPSAGAWGGGTLIDFQGVPEDYWYHGGGQSLYDYYHGLYFYPTTNILESTVYGYNDVVFPWHSSDAVLSTDHSNLLRVYFAEEKIHVGFWYATANGDGIAEAYDVDDNLLDTAVLLENPGVNNYISLDAPGIEYVEIRHGSQDYTVIDDLEYRPVNVMQNTVDAAFTCNPLSGTLPFAVNMAVELTNPHPTQTRRIAGQIFVRLANGASYGNWRNGFTTLGPLGSYTASWTQNLPALSALVGTNRFSLSALDVTPAPWNQPPYAPSGDGEVRACNITASAP